MRFFRLWLSGVSACCLAFSLPFVSYASVATSSEAVPVASGSNARPATPSEPLPMDPDVLEDRFDTLDPPAFTSDGDSGFGVDWSYDGIWTTSSNVAIRQAVYRNGFYYFERPGSDYYLSGFRLLIKKSSLPASGKYGFSCTIPQGNIDFGSFSEGRIQFDIAPTNVKPSYNQFKFDTVSNNGSVYKASVNVTIPSSCQGLSVMFMFKTPFTYGDVGTPTFEFLRQPLDNVPNLSDGDINYGSDISSGIEQQVQQGDTIIELIKNTIQTISSQLTAFWNQLAGEFTNLYNKMTAEHAEDLAKVDEQIEADRQNTDDIIANQDQNTNTITNGYDSSALDQSSNALNDKLTEYDKIESGIHDSASSWISDFTLPDFDNLIDSGGILAACVWLGSFWQDLFTQMGAFNIPVTLSLSLVFVLMLVGYHRFRR